MAQHYSITEWLDLQRGFSSPELRSAMESHRVSCDRCSETLAWVERLQVTALADFKSDVPLQVTRNAQAIFALRRFDAIQFNTGSIAKMIFDSFNQPALQGVRSEQRSDVRHMLYEVEGYVIDLRLEHERGLSAVSMVGQIHHADNPDSKINPMPVKLTANDIELASTVCNNFGEFALAYVPQNALRLHLGLDAVGGQKF